MTGARAQVRPVARGRRRRAVPDLLPPVARRRGGLLAAGPPACARRPWLFAFADARRPGDEGEVDGGVHREIEAWMDILAGVGC
jgi:hypothetical protein